MHTRSDEYIVRVEILLNGHGGRIIYDGKVEALEGSKGEFDLVKAAIEQAAGRCLSELAIVQESRKIEASRKAEAKEEAKE